MCQQEHIRKLTSTLSLNIFALIVSTKTFWSKMYLRRTCHKIYNGLPWSVHPHKLMKDVAIVLNMPWIVVIWNFCSCFLLFSDFLFVLCFTLMAKFLFVAYIYILTDACYHPVCDSLKINHLWLLHGLLGRAHTHMCVCFTKK